MVEFLNFFRNELQSNSFHEEYNSSIHANLSQFTQTLKRLQITLTYLTLKSKCGNDKLTLSE